MLNTENGDPVCGTSETVRSENMEPKCEASAKMSSENREPTCEESATVNSENWEPTQRKKKGDGRLIHCNSSASVLKQLET